MPIHVGLRALSSGTAGTLQTLKLMRGIIRQNKHDPTVLQLARHLTANLPPKAYGQEVAALFYFVRDQIRYTRDINGTETLQTPEATLRLGSGDCDDKVILLASLLESIGHPTRSVAMKEFPDSIEFGHVFLQSRVGPAWVSLETTEPWPPGKTPPFAGRPLMVYN